MTSRPKAPTDRLARLAVAAVSAALVASPATPQTAGQVLERAAPRAETPERAPLPAAGAPVPSVIDMVGAGAFRLQGVSLEGVTAYPAGAFEPVWRDLVGRRIGAAELAAAASAVQSRYRADGYVFTRVVAAPPPHGSGVARIVVVEAVVESVAVEEPEGPVGPARALVARLARPLEGLRNPRLADLERALLLINDIPGVDRATAVPRAGAGGPGALALSINVVRDPWSAVVFADDRQQPAFGPGLLGLQAEYASYGAAGDTTTAIVSTAFWDSREDLDERRIVQVEQTRHLGGAGTRAGLRGLYSRTRPGAELEPIGLAGQEVEFEAWVEHPVTRTRAFSLWARGGLSWQDEELVLDDSGFVVVEDHARTLYAEIETLSRDAFGYTSIVLGARKGVGLFGASEKGDQSLSRLDGDPDAALLQASFEREQPLAFGAALFVEAGGQFALSPLLGGQEFAIGGATFGRGYDPSEFTGDNGIGVNVEVRYRDRRAFAVAAVDAEFYAFADAGKIWNLEDGAPDEADIASVGAGVRAVIDGALRLTAEVAKPAEPLLRTGSDDWRVFFGAQRRF